MLVLVLYGAIAGLDQGLHYVLPSVACGNCQVCCHHDGAGSDSADRSVYAQYRLERLRAEQGRVTLRSGTPVPDPGGQCVVCLTLAQMVGVTPGAVAGVIAPRPIGLAVHYAAPAHYSVAKRLHAARGPPAAGHFC